MNKNDNIQYLHDIVTTGYGEKDMQYENFINNFDIEACDYTDEYQTSFLQNAISHRKYNITKFLIENNCNINNQDTRGYAALDYLLVSKQDEEIALLDKILNANPALDLEDFEYKNQPLWEAVMNAKVPLTVIQRLLEMGADPHHKNIAGHTPYSLVKEYNIAELNEIFEPYI